MAIAVIRIKGKVNVKKEVEKTLQLLRLYRKHHCTIMPNRKEIIGMLKKVDRYITWGEIDENILKQLLEKRGRLPGNKKLTQEYIKEKTGKNVEDVAKEIVDGKMTLKDIPGLKQFFRLKPPTKGFERKGMKKPFSLGGVFGYRGKNINSLLERMI
ncbi:MAG: 50S ribosomal protein L30 [Nanoarchaeota archaeon]|nr:50S ribosomal protein L30 [Nanoarchaeota archaeon]